jgi:ComF family protein
MPQPLIAPPPQPSPLEAAWRGVLDFLLPPRCFACHQPVEAQGSLCAACWGGLTFITEPLCAACGYPFPHGYPVGVLCGNCTRLQPAFDSARAALAYDDGSRGLILRFKHAEATEGLPALTGWLLAAGREALARADVLVPVPLHPRRLFARRFNQSAHLARALAARTGVPVDLTSLRRVKNTKSQGKLSAVKRAQNVRGAFKAPPEAFAGKAVVVIDDVLTTGATADQCARALKATGAKAVDVLALSRVVSPFNKMA